MRRLFVIALGSALLLSACGTSSVWPGASAGAGTPRATSAGSDALSATPTVDATTAPSKAAPTAKITAAPTDATADWTTTAPAGAGFSVQMPGTPTFTTSTTKSASGDVPTSMWAFEDGTDLGYFVVVGKYPKGTISKQVLATVYSNAIAGMTTSTSGFTVADQGDVTLSGHAGKSFTLTSASGTVRGELVLVGDNLYMAYVAWTPALDGSTVMDTFLSSFKLTA